MTKVHISISFPKSKVHRPNKSALVPEATPQKYHVISLGLLYERSIHIHSADMHSYVMFVWLISHGWKYCWLICLREKYCSLSENVLPIRQGRVGVYTNASAHWLWGTQRHARCSWHRCTTQNGWSTRRGAPRKFNGTTTKGGGYTGVLCRRFRPWFYGWVFLTAENGGRCFYMHEVVMGIIIN